jgi:IS30 family transposase
MMILRLKREGYANRKIAEIIGRDYFTITKFLKRYDERNSVENKPNTGRKQLVMERGDRVILRSVTVNRRETLRDLTNIVNKRLPRHVSARTIIKLTWQAYLCTNLHDFFSFVMTLLKSSEFGTPCNHDILICGERF